MTGIPYLTPDGCLVLDNSSLVLVKTCPTMSKYRLLDKRERAGTAIARDAGKAFHAALEARYTQAGSAWPNQAVVDAMEQAIRDGFAGLETTEDDYLTEAKLIDVMRAYNDGCAFEMKAGATYQFAGYQAEPFDVLGVEVPFAIRLGYVTSDGRAVPVYWIGRSDLLVRWRERGETMVLDHKTGREWTARTLVTWQTASGPKGYAWALPRYVRDGIDHLPPSLREAMQPHEPKRLALAEDGFNRVDGFCLNSVTIRDLKNPKLAKNPPLEFHRHQVYYDDHVLNEWHRDTLRWCQTWLEWCTSGHWPMNDQHCASFFGRACPFLEVCSVPPAQRELVLGTDLYQPATWSPLDRTTDNGNS